MTVVEFEDYRPKPNGPANVTFFGFPFKTRENQNWKLTVTITIENGDVDSVIEAFRENGGVWLPDDDGVSSWWLPWPCAAIKVSPAAAQAS